MRTVVFGGMGQLGRDVASLFEQSGPTHSLGSSEVDITDADAVSKSIQEFNPTLVINAAAYTNVEAAEDNREAAFLVNEIGAANVARAAAASDIPVVYYSTDYVFGGAKRRPYEVDDAIAPICVYAQSKTAGEEATRAANAKHFIVRTAWLYGPTGNCFPEKMLRLAAERPELKVVDEEIGSPTHTYDLAEATMALVEKAPFGTYHGVNNGSCSRYTFAKRVLELAGVDTPVLPCSSSEFKSKAERPLYSVLSTTAIQSATGYTLRDWEDALAHYMVRRTASEAKG